MKCVKCKKQVKELITYGPFDGKEHYYSQGLWFCEKCFEKEENKYKKGKSVETK